MNTDTAPRDATSARRITRVLIANRGEIARRIIRTCDRLGLETVAVFSDPDRGSPHVDEATYAVALGGSASAESYLDAGKILDAAQRSGADAVHPGYGFLSENPDFAEAAIAAGLVWVGPTPASMRSMALKVEAKRIATRAGVPLVPGSELADDVSPEQLACIAAGVGYPLLVKASAGGGGKGMRVVREPGSLDESIAGARREAAAAFGDATVFLERYVEHARHVEVQVFGDELGEVVHLFERECSIQRRHQKIVEESPSPGATPGTLEGMYGAAVALAQSIWYVGAGTVEFLVSGEGADQEFFFLEMNTRLQVEHPVTEAITGLDLVEWQFVVAQGRPLPHSQDDISRDGHAIEVRLYAEDPAHGFLPSTGVISAWDEPEGVGIRIDAGVEARSVVSPHYDPMLAKVICHAPSRPEAAARLSDFLRDWAVLGVTTNRFALAAILANEDFLAGATTTDFLDTHPDVLSAVPPREVVGVHLLIAGLVLADIARTNRPVPPGWRNVPGTPETWHLRRTSGGDDHAVSWAWNRTGTSVWVVPLGDASDSPLAAYDLVRSNVASSGSTVRWMDVEGDDGFAEYRFDHDGVIETIWARVELRDDRRAGVTAISVDARGWLDMYEVVEPWASSDHATDGGGPSTPVPGTITHVAVAVGDPVEVGTPLAVLEAMKMEHTIRADSAGTVSALHVRVGQGVDAHILVATITQDAEVGT